MNRPFLLPSACRRPIREHNCPWGPMSKRAEEPSQHVLLHTANQRAHQSAASPPCAYRCAHTANNLCTQAHIRVFLEEHIVGNNLSLTHSFSHPPSFTRAHTDSEAVLDQSQWQRVQNATRFCCALQIKPKLDSINLLLDFLTQIISIISKVTAAAFPLLLELHKT